MRVEAGESVRPPALKETAGIAGKQARDDAEVSRGRPRATAAA